MVTTFRGAHEDRKKDCHRVTETPSKERPSTRVEMRSFFLEIFVEEGGHELIGFQSFGECGVVPESVGQRFEHDELRVNSGAQIGAVEDGGPAEK